MMVMIFIDWRCCAHCPDNHLLVLVGRRKTMNQVQQVRKQVEQLRREAASRRITIHQASSELKKYVEDHRDDDILVNGFATQKENPFKDKASCSIL